MGGILSTQTTSSDEFSVHPAISGAYAGALADEERRNGFDTSNPNSYAGGGCGCGGNEERLGGASGDKLDLAEASEYVNSINSKSKTRIIESILEAAGKLGLKTEGSSPAARIKSLLAAIPAGDRFKKDDKTQIAVCESIAKAINSAYGVKVMETNLPGDALCQHIAEILSSLGAGVHTEFLAVYNDVQKVLHNLGLLETQLGADMAQIKDKIRGCEDGVTAKNLQLNFDLHEMLTQEIKRQVQMLSNLLNVHLIPSASDLSKLLKDKKELHGWIKKIDLKPGSDKFGRVISDLIRGLGMTANFMLIVEQALSTVGVTMSEYKNMKSLSDLRAAVVSKGVSLSGDELHKFNDALSLLEKNLSKVKYTNKEGSYSETQGVFSSSGIGSTVGSSDSSKDISTEMEGAGCGYSGSAEYAKSTMDKRVADRKKLRNLIYETFVRQLSGALDKFIGSIDVLSMKIGTEIPISDQLDGFRQAINRVNIELARKKQIYLALIGYYNDAMSKSKRDQVIGELKMVSSFIDSIVELPMYRASSGYFQAVQMQIKGILDIIGKYTDDIAAKFGRGETPEEASERSVVPVENKEGGYAEEHYGGNSESDHYEGGDSTDFPAPKFRSTKTLPDAVRQFDYKFRVAQIRGNLARSGAELSHYGEKYEKITANSLAEVLKAEQLKYRGLVKLLESETANAETPDEAAAARKFLDSQWESKKKFWATVEAMDGYMRAFTNGLVNNPNDIKDIRAILDDVEVIRDWYSEASGNQLATVFDHFPHTLTASTDASFVEANYPSKAHLSQDGSESHYYESISKNNVTPGNHNNVAAPSKAAAARDMLKRMLGSMTALKNLLSVFVHFGSKFGGNDLNKSTFLTPAQIYNNLIDYLQASAFQQGVGNGVLTFKSDGNVESVGTWNTDTGANVSNMGLSDKGKFVRHWGSIMRSVGAGKEDENGLNFVREDEYFVIMMKAIGAKILTVTSMYDVMDRPHEFNGITPIRMIMGGDAETPKVEEGAVALYLRLPLLCQFWRVIFNFDERVEGANGEGVNRFASFPGIPTKGNEALKISMVPDVDGTFSGLIRLIFRKQKYLDTSAYSDDDIKSILRECNAIYQKMSAKHSQNTVMETIYELIAEVNRRYGIVTKSDRDTYESEFGSRYDYADPNGTADRYTRDPDPSDIALLPGEDEESIPRPSAAERLLEGTDFTKSENRASKYNINLAHRDLLYKFRCVIDKFFENPREEYSFNGAIKATQQKLKRETRDEERFKIVASLIRGVDVYSKVDGIKYLFFHETVVAGLNVLSGLHSMLARFQARAQLLDLSLIIEAAQKALEGVASSQAVADKLVELFKGKAAYMDENELTSLAEELFGKNEAGLCESGRRGATWSIRPTADMQSQDVLRFNGQTVGADKSITPGTGGLAKVLAGIQVGQLRSLFFDRQTDESAKSSQQNVLCFFRYLINREFAMKEILESLFGLSSDLQGLVEVRIDDGKVYMNAGGLKSLINELFEQVGYFIDLLRPHIRRDIMEKYTSKLHAGSLYWLQEQLMEKIIQGRPGTNTSRAYNNLDDQMRSISDMYSFLTREFLHDGKNIANGVANAVKSRNSFDKVFASLIFYDGERPGSGLLPSKDADSWDGTAKVANSLPKLVSWQTDPYEALHLAGPPGSQVLDTRFASRFYQLYSWKDELTLNRSALFVFNQLVAKFIQSFYDPGQKKLYKGLIDQFANGTFNRAINDHRFTYPDVAPAVVSKFSGPEDLNAAPALIAPTQLGPIADAARTPLINYIKGLPAPGILTVAGLRRITNPAIIAAIGQIDQASNNIIPEVINAFPYSNDTAGTSAREKESRAAMFVDMLFSVVIKLATDPDLSKAVISTSQELSSRKVYSTGRASEASYLVPAADMMGVNSSYASKSSLPGPAYEEKILMFARDAAVGNGINAKSIEGLGIERPAGGAGGNKLLSFGNRADPDGDHVLFTSLAVVIRNLVHTRMANPTQNLVYMTENAADVPIYIKEKMRANLPAFKNLFRELITRCEFLKKFMMRREMSIDRYWTSQPTHNPWPWGLAQPVAGESERAKDRFTSILDTIVRGCQTLITATETTLKEIGDDPKYLEMYQGSIRDYRAQYGVDPLMPVSSLLAVLNNTDEKTELDFFPIHSLGELHFKMMYAGRSLLQNMAAQPTAESVPGWTQTIESYNLMVDNRLQADKGHCDGLLKALTKGVRYLYDLKRMKGLLTPYVGSYGCAGDYFNGTMRDSLYWGGSLVRADLISTGAAQITNRGDISIVSADVDKLLHLKPVFSLRNPLTRVVMLSESSNKDDQLKNLIEYICGDEKDGNRSNTLAVQNIIDLNIIPINVHALMREIPLANLYNYAYTYDRAMIELYYGQAGDSAKDMIRDLCGVEGALQARINSPKDMLVALLLDPYLNVNATVSNNIDSRTRAEYVQGMLLGSTAEEGLGRPKFLSDQIFGKAIFGELYSSWSSMSDQGPEVQYARTVPRAAIHKGMANAIATAVGFATYRGAMFANGNITPGECDKISAIIMDDQTASIESIAKKLNAAGIATAESAGFRDALTILSKTVGTAFLWAIDRSIKGDSASDVENVVKSIIESLQGITWNNSKLNVTGMGSVNYKAEKAFNHIRDSLSSAVITNNPIANAGGSVYTSFPIVVNGSVFRGLEKEVKTSFDRRLELTDPSSLHKSFGRPISTSDATSLHFLKDGDLKAVAVGEANITKLQTIGRDRFDTVIIRNLVFVVNLYRSVRMRLQRDLTYNKDIITKSIPITRNQLTEFIGNQSWKSRAQDNKETRYE